MNYFPIINQVFNNYTNYDSIEKIESSLTQYMYIVIGTKSNDFSNMKIEFNANVNTKESYSLFWMIFIAIYGKEEYIQINSRYDNREIDERQKISEYIKSSLGSAIFKQTNYKVSKIKIQEILSEMIVNYTTKENSFLLCLAFCVFYKKNIYILNQRNHTYISYIIGLYEENIYLDFSGKNKYEILEKTKATQLMSEYFLIENPDKLLKGISTYKLDELRKILELVEKNVIDNRRIENGTDIAHTIIKSVDNMTKQELYDAIKFNILQYE